MLRLFRHHPVSKRNYGALWKQWCKIIPTRKTVFNLQTKSNMPSAIRKMQLNEAFDSINEDGEVRLLEIAQMLAERYPKRIPLTEDGSANDEGAATIKSWAQLMVRPSMLM